MIILCTHNSGGVGKTTLAIHITGVLKSKFPLSKTLLIDCDDQADSWEFYTRIRPTNVLQLLSLDNLSVLYNEDRRRIESVVDLEEYDYIVIDVRSPRKDTIRIIINDDPDLILVPINPSQKSKAAGNLDRTLGMISILEYKLGFSPEVIIVPLGVSQDVISDKLQKIPNQPKVCRMAPPIRYLQDEMQIAIYEERKYIWEYEGCEDVYFEFCSILGI